MQVIKTVKFEMAHRLSNYKGLCKNVHGHSYKVDIILEGETLNKSGMVLDFSEIKTLWQPLNDKLDHSIMLENCAENQQLINLLNTLGMRVNVVDYNPTAENMAKYFYTYLTTELSSLYKNEVKVKAIRVHETDTSFAEFSDASK